MENDDWISGSVTLTIGGRPVEMQMVVPAAPVKPQRMLPIFHKMANSFVDHSVAAVEATGKTISCKAGCGACCRQPVPISGMEVYQLAEVVDAMPEPRRTEVRARFAAAVDHFQKIGWFDEIKERAQLTGGEDYDVAMKKLLDVAMRYFYEGIPCPFLENESCSIHEVRPTACREYLVTTPAENCSKPTAQTVSVVELMLKPSSSLRHISNNPDLASLGFLPLIRALEVAEMFPDNYEEKTGQAWMADFFADISARSKRKKPARGSSGDAAAPI